MAEDTSNVGPRIREMRKINGMTLQELSEFTGLSVGHLSQIERGMASPTLASLGKIAETLETTVSHLVSGPDEENLVIRKGEQEVATFPETRTTVGYYRFSNTPTLLEDLVIEPGEVPDQPWARHVCPEMAIVVEGEMTVEFEDERYVLHPGDSVIIPRNRRHKLLNEGGVPSHSVWVYLRRS